MAHAAAQPAPRTHQVLDYMPQLDGLRALAVGMVMFWHFGDRDHMLGVRWGPLGVLLFFVLSGYLITGILLSCRQAMDASGQSALWSARQFYLRRFLRIFPLFYAALLGAWLLDLPPIRQTLGWHVTYLSNVLTAGQGRYNQSSSHLWSLAVEEQFYLLWPWFILLAPRRLLLPGAAAMVLLAPAWRAATLALGHNEVTASVLMPANLDTLGLGAVLAMLQRPRPAEVGGGDDDGGRATLLVPLTWAMLAVGLAGLALLRWGMHPRWVGAGTGPVARTILTATCFGLVSAWLIHRAARGLPGPAGWLLACRPMVYLGRISYGLYVIHNFVPFITPRLNLNAEIGLHPLVWRATTRIGLSESSVNLVVFPLLWTALSVALAALSWHLFEKPLNDLKRHFPYTKTAEPRGHTGRLP